jgi:hypothetical protein
MNQVEPTPNYPEGIAPRTPRPRQVLLGALLGGLAGLALSEKAGGVALGGAIGGLLGNRPLELSQALRQAFAAKGFEIVHFYRLGRFGAKLIFKFGNTYVSLESHAPRQPEMSLEQIEDWLYGDLTENKLNKFVQEYSQKFLK